MTDYEEVIYAGETGSPDEVHKASLDTILEITKNP